MTSLNLPVAPEEMGSVASRSLCSRYTVKFHNMCFIYTDAYFAILDAILFNRQVDCHISYCLIHREHGVSIDRVNVFR